MDGYTCFGNLRASGFLSFGPKGVNVDLQPLNVLIGPNASVKSNFLEIFRLLRSLTTDVDSFADDDSSSDDFIWKGEDANGFAEFEVQSKSYARYDHTFVLAPDQAHTGFVIPIEKLVRAEPTRHVREMYNKDESSTTYLKTVEVETKSNARKVEYRNETIPEHEEFYGSVLSHPELNIAHLPGIRRTYNSIRWYGALSFGKLAAPRKSQKSDLDQTYLFEDGSNLANIVGALQHQTPVYASILSKLKVFYPNAARLITGLAGNKVQLYLEEHGMFQTIPASRFSDGTIRFLCMLALLMHPDPPKVICLEEPELGLHPDVIRMV